MWVRHWLGDWPSLAFIVFFDMLLHLPRDYEDRSRVIAIKDVSHGMSALVAGVVTWVEKNRTGLSVTLEDATGGDYASVFVLIQVY